MESLPQIPAIGDGGTPKFKSIPKAERKPNYGGGGGLSLLGVPQFQKNWKSTWESSPREGDPEAVSGQIEH